MRQAFTMAVVMLVAFLITEKAVMRAQPAEQGSVSCAKGAELVRLNALGKGYSARVSTSQGENFLSGCLVTGRGRIGDLVARD